MPPAGETDYIKIGAQQLGKESVQRRPPNPGRNEVPRPNSGAPHFGLRSPHKSQSLPHLHVGLPHKNKSTKLVTPFRTEVTPHSYHLPHPGIIFTPCHEGRGLAPYVGKALVGFTPSCKFLLGVPQKPKKTPLDYRHLLSLCCQEPAAPVFNFFIDIGVADYY